MSILNFFKKGKNENIDFIKNNDLEKWWENTFSDRERKIIISESSNLLSQSTNSDKSTAKTLYLIAGNVITKFYNRNPDVIIRILKKAEELAADPLELFEIYSQLIKLHMERENEDQREAKKIEALCQKQIGISDEVLKILKEENSEAEKSNYPTHIAYKKLALLRAEEGKKKEAAKLLKKAKEENWSGNWEELLEKIT